MNGAPQLFIILLKLYFLPLSNIGRFGHSIGATRTQQNAMGDALIDAAARGGRKGEAWMPTSTCGTEFYLLPKPGEEHGELVGPELVSEMDTDQSGMRIVSYGQYVSLPRPSSACLPPLLSMNASRFPMMISVWPQSPKAVPRRGAPEPSARFKRKPVAKDAGPDTQLRDHHTHSLLC